MPGRRPGIFIWLFAGKYFGVLLWLYYEITPSWCLWHHEGVFHNKVIVIGPASRACLVAQFWPEISSISADLQSKWASRKSKMNVHSWTFILRYGPFGPYSKINNVVSHVKCPWMDTLHALSSKMVLRTILRYRKWSFGPFALKDINGRRPFISWTESPKDFRDAARRAATRPSASK